MPKVPQYQGPQETLHPLDISRPRSVGPINAGGRDQAQLGDALFKTGINVYGQMRDREIADTVFRAETAIKEEWIGFESEVREKRQGRFAKDLTQDTAKWWDERANKHSQGLDSAAQRIFRQRATQFKTQSVDGVSRWEAVQLEKSHDEAWTAAKKSTIGSAIAAGTPDAIDAARAEIERQNRYQASRKGWEPEATKAKNLEDTTELHENVISKMALNDPAGAAEYFNKWKHEIVGTRHDEVGKFAKDVSANAIGDQVADVLWLKHGPKADADPVNLDELEKQARGALKGNPAAMKAAISGLKERTVAFDKGVKEREAVNGSAAAQAVLEGRSLREIRGMPEFQRLSGAKQLAMVEHIENTRYTRARRISIEAASAEAEQARRNNAAYLNYSDPNVLKDMSRNEVIALLPSLGRVHTEQLVTKWDSLSKSETRVHEARMDQEDFNHVAQRVGLKPFETKKSEDEKAALGELKFRIEQRIDAEQEKAKRKLTRAEKMIVMQQEMDNKVLVDRFLLPDPTKPVILLTPDEIKNAYVEVDGQRVNLSSIPAGDREEIMKGLQKRGLPVTEQEIAKIWTRSKGKKDEPGGFDADVRKLKNVGAAIAASIPRVGASIAGVGQAAGEALSTFATGPLAGKILPEDIGAKMAAWFVQSRKRQLAVADRWRPKQGVDFDVVRVPPGLRGPIEELLKRNGMPVTEETMVQVYRAWLEMQRAGQSAAPEATE